MSPERKDEEFSERIGRKEERKMRARREGEPNPWFGLGMFGLVGWSVAIPTVIGTAIGVWLDADGGGDGRSWTLTLLGAGLGVGCLTAWFWVRRESGGGE
ncbi:AtpZ/AtpI family protein [Desulfohalovibrio reitneri]|uniref:AtpZ/AtpI family protein n=1 Tax=Desulfohalovibrio reitneri TaxID=1307759 RepID=UPI0004A6E343|nr:AtpZ/AtpI family protein [Desulfohalovibrio reitneri]